MIERGHLVRSLVAGGFLGEVRNAFSLLIRRERRQAALLVFSMNINAVLGLVGVAGILPFIHLLTDSAPLDGQGFFARAFRSVGLSDPDHAIYLAGGTILAVVILKNVFLLVHTRFQNRFSAQVEIRLATELLARVVGAPYSWLVTKNSSILRDVVVGQSIEWSRSVVRAGLQLLNDLLFLFCALAFLIVASPLAGLAICCFAAILASGLSAFTHPRVAHHTERKQRAIRLAGVTASEAIGGGRDIRLSGAGSFFISSFTKDIREYSINDAKGRQLQTVPRLGLEIVGFSVLIGVALVALWSGMQRADIAALLTLYAVVAIRAIPIIGQVTSSISMISGALPAVAELRGLMDELPVVPPYASAGVDVKSLAWRCLSFNNVSFNYPGVEKPALGPLTLRIKSGSSYGIVGRSGAGKSTLVDLIAGLLPPTEGQLLLDGKSLEGPHLTSWIGGLAFVSQVPFLLDATLADNIEFGQPRTFDHVQRLNAAIDAAGLTETVRGLPLGSETSLGERGVLLSGGQRQRVAIARALYRRAQLLILDEATSALDSLTEKEITDSVDAVKGRITLVVVAHRISTVMRLDEIITIENGKIAGQGTHEALLSANAVYRSLVEAQRFVETLPRGPVAIAENNPSIIR